MGWLSTRVGLWVPAAVFVGLALRVYHYLRCPAVWHDEAALIVNVLGLSFGEMFGPLLHAEAAPPLFLMAEHLAERQAEDVDDERGLVVPHRRTAEEVVRA